MNTSNVQGILAVPKVNSSSRRVKMPVPRGTLEKFALFTGKNLRAAENVYPGLPVDEHVIFMLERSERTRKKEYEPDHPILDQEQQEIYIIALLKGAIHQRQRKDRLAGKSAPEDNAEEPGTDQNEDKKETKYDEHHAEFVRPGEPTNVSFGISQLPRVSSAYAFSVPTEVVLLHNEDFLNAMQLSRALTLNTMIYMSTRVILYLKYSDWIYEMKKTPDERVLARFLLEAHDALNPDGNVSESQTPIRITHEQLSQYIAVSADRVRRNILPRWEAAGIIANKRNEFTIHKKTRLELIRDGSEDQDRHPR